MTGEMRQSEVTKENYPDLFKLRDALHRRGIPSEPRPFDIYQGPYLAVRNDLRCGDEPYACLTFLPGVLRVWLADEADLLGVGFLIESAHFEFKGASYEVQETPESEPYGVYTLRQAAKRIAVLMRE